MGWNPRKPAVPRARRCLGGLGVAVSLLVAMPGEDPVQAGEHRLLAQATPGPAPGGSPSAPAGTPAGPGTPPPVPAPLPPADPLWRTPAPATIPSAPAPGFQTFQSPTNPAATFELHYSLGVSEEYSDNFNLSQTDKQSNFRTAISPGITLLINGARTRGQLSYTPSFSYDSSDNGTHFFQAFVGQVIWEATPRFRLTAADTLSFNDDPLTAGTLNQRRERTPYVSNEFSLIGDYSLDTISASAYYLLSTFFDDGGADTISNTVGATLGKTFLVDYTATVGYEFLYSTTSDNGDNVTGNAGTLSLARRLNRETTVGLSGSFAYRTVTGGGLPDDQYYIASGSAFGTYQVPGVWSVSASLGYGTLWGQDDARQDSDHTGGTPLATLFITYLLPRGVITLEGHSGFSESFTRGENFGVVRTVGASGSISHAITPQVGANATVFWDRNAETGIAGGTAGDPQNTYGGSIGLGYRPLPWPWLSFGLVYTITQADGDDGYTENRVTATVTASF
jgi:hypothetical protein